MKFAYSCTKPAVSVEGTVTNKGDNAYTATMTSTSMVDGKPQTSTVRTKGKFLSADCGNVKPIAAP